MVPLGLRDDLARQGRLHLVVADHRALDLEAVAVRLDDHPRVEAASRLDRGVEPARLADLDDADAGAEP